jgi:TonB family protein
MPQAIAQEVNEFGMLGPETVLKSPFGKPLMVMDEAGVMQHPIEVYSDSSVEKFVPDVTTDGWISWHADQFRRLGTYDVILYTFDRATHKTRRQYISVDTRVQTAIVRDGIWGEPSKLVLPKMPVQTRAAIARTSEIISAEIMKFRGLTIQQAVQHDRPIVAKMAQGASSNQPIALVGTADSHASRHSEPVRYIDGKAVYRIGGDIKPPTILRSVDAEFSAEDAKKKTSSSVSIQLVVGEDGHPVDVHITRGLTPGLDENALQAVRQYQFKPATKNGSPVMVELSVNVEFTPF